LTAAQSALGSGPFRAETITHTLLSVGHTLDSQDGSFETAQENLDRVIADATTLHAQSIELFTGRQGAMIWEDAAARFGAAAAPCLAGAKAAGIELVAENTPSLYTGMHLANSLRDTLTVAELTGIGICIDVASCWAEAGSSRRSSTQFHIPRLCKSLITCSTMMLCRVGRSPAMELHRCVGSSIGS
jgi:hypothetical protein